MSVNTTLISYKSYGKCLKMENGICELIITVDVGPRIISFSLADKENMFFNDETDAINKEGPEFDEMFYKGAKWHIYGGHRLWVSPESLPETYYPDNTPVPYEINGNKVILNCEEEIHNKRQYTITVTMSEDSADVTVLHEIKNNSGKLQKFAPWSLNVTDKGGCVIVPQTKRETGLLANRVISVWDYSDMSDKRVMFGKDFITLHQETDCNGAFKIGTNNENGCAYIVNKGQAFKIAFNFIDGAEYPDFGCSFETYTNEHMLEVETISPLQDVMPGESSIHEERWSLKPVDFEFDGKSEEDCKKVTELF